MRYLSIWMLVSGVGEREKGELVTKLYISSLCAKFRTMCICIILIVNLPPE